MIKRKNISNSTSLDGACQHPAYYNSLCVSCGAKLVGSIEGKLSTNSSSQSDNKYDFTLTGGSQLKLSSVEVERIEQSKRQSLHSMRKLALILDIDHTLLHATPTSTLPSKVEVDRYQLECIGVNSDDTSSKYYHLIKLRPGLLSFLEEANKKYQLSIYTAGTRTYAESVVKLIDPTGILFRRRIMSRTDTPQPDSHSDGLPVNPCEKSLARLFVGESSHMAVILDDREDVWKGPQGLQLLVVRPFIYFSDARDVNNSSGLQPSAAVCAADAISLSGSRPGSVRRVLHDGPTSGVFGQVSGYSVSAQAHFDDQLERSLAILDKIHADYYELYDEKVASSSSSSSSSSPFNKSINRNHHDLMNGINHSYHSLSSSSSMSLTDLRVESVLTTIKSRVLAGCSIVFSGVIPRADPSPEQNYFWRLAVSLGAEVTLDLTSQTTHLIASLSQVQPLQQQILPPLASSNSTAARTSTNSSSGGNGSAVTQIQRGVKVTACISRDNVYIVHSDWLLYCRYSIARANEKTFSMIPGVPTSLDTLTLSQQQQSQPSSPRDRSAAAVTVIDLTSSSEEEDTSNHSCIVERGNNNSNSSSRSSPIYNTTTTPIVSAGAAEEEEEEVMVVINAEGLIDIVEKKKPVITAAAADANDETNNNNNNNNHHLGMNGSSSNSNSNSNSNNNNSSSDSSSSNSSSNSSSSSNNNGNSKKRKSEEISDGSSHPITYSNDDTHTNGKDDGNDETNHAKSNNDGDDDDDDDDAFGDMFDRVLVQNTITTSNSAL